MSATWMQGDVFEQMAKIPDGSIDLIVTSPPFLALRSYLPADHPDKHREIGSEATPADFLDTLLELTAEWGRVLAPHGSICVELGDTYAGSGGAGGDYNPETGLRAGQPAYKGSNARQTDRVTLADGRTIQSAGISNGQERKGPGWPLAKSLTGIPTLYAWSLAYGRNLLTGAPSPAGQWRIRNVIVWARPNPPVGALGDKFRPATSYITVACRGPRRYFDLDAVRGPGSPNTHARLAVGVDSRPTNGKKADNPNNNYGSMDEIETAGAPPLDWHTDDHPEDGDWLWKLATAPYKGAHYATYPLALPTRLIEAMCPQRVCQVCGKPSERISQVDGLRGTDILAVRGDNDRANGLHGARPPMPDITRTTVGWTDCGCAVTPVCHNDRDDESGSSCRQGVSSTASAGSTPDSSSRWRRGHVLDPFAGSGTTGAAAVGVGRDATLIDIDARNLELARERIGMFLEEAESERCRRCQKPMTDPGLCESCWTETVPA